MVLAQVALALVCVLYELPQAAAQPAAAPTPAISANASGLAPCEPSVILVPDKQLVNLTESNCDGDADGSASNSLLFARGRPFGFTWADLLPGNCSIQSVQAMVLPGFSCTGAAEGGGAVTLNGQQLPQRYVFPFDTLGSDACDCGPPQEPLQVISVPVDSYGRGRNNTLSISSKSGTNGLAALTAADVTNDRSVYAAVAVNAWTQAAPLPTARASFGYMITLDYVTLAVGGVAANGSLLSSADEYSGSTGTWAPTANGISVAVANSRTALLSSVRESQGESFLLNAGGVDASNTTRAEADIYNTVTRSFSPAKPMGNSRAQFQLTAVQGFTTANSTLASSNRALATGGVSGGNGSWSVLASAEMYDYDAASWTVRANMAQARYRHRASRLLIDGSALILVTGGISADGRALASAELMDGTGRNGTWQSAGSMAQARYDHVAYPLTNGSVLVCGGAYIAADGTEAALRSCELFTNGTGWSPMRNLTTARIEPRGARMQDGTLFLAGGRNEQGAVQSTELWNNNTGGWIPIGSMPTAPLQFGLGMLPDGRLLAFGGGSSSSGSASAPVNGTSGTALFTQAFKLSTVDSTPAPTPGSARRPAPAAASSLGTGAIIGTVVGGVVLLVAALALPLLFLLRQRRRRMRAEAEASNAKLRGTDSTPSGGRPRTASQNGHAASRDAARGSGLHSLMASMAAVVWRRKAAPAAAPPPPPAQGLSVELRKAQASPFDSSGLTATPVSVAGPAAAVLPSAVASRFDSLTGSRSASPLHTGALDPVPSPVPSGGASDVVTQNTGVSRASGRTSSEDPFDSGSALSRPSRAGSKHMGIQGIESSCSHVSRVSVAIHNKLSASEWKIERGSLTLGKRLGKGGFGEVFEGRHHGSAVAVKVLKIADDRTMLDARNEFGFLHRLRHSKLVISYGACVDGNNLLLVMERMEEDLFHAIASDQTMAGDSVLWYFRGWKIAVDVASSLVFLHSKGMIHLDVKSLNILLRGKRAEAKLGDTGLARLVPEGALFLQNTLPGTPAYSVPEVMQAQLQWRLRTQGRKDQFRTEVGTPADIFAFGVVLFEICTGCHPARWRQEFTGELRPEQGPPAIAKLIDDCLSDDPLLRPSAAQVLDILLENKPPNAQE